MIRKDITVESSLDPCWVEMQAMKKHFPRRTINLRTGKYRYLYSSKKGTISLLFESRRMMLDHRERFWEIFCLQGKLFEGPERFATRSDAEKRIEKLLC